MGYLSFTDAASMFGIGMGEFLTHIGSREGYADKEFLSVTLNYFRREFPEYEARDIEERTFQWKGSKYEREVKPRRIEEAERRAVERKRRRMEQQQASGLLRRRPWIVHRS